ncbi:MAG: glucosamine-6-phosphate deaminase [Clostridia bacterium]|nr:glucosamine-6-phosphate deaminase [Clostridia bacterium]
MKVIVCENYEQVSLEAAKIFAEQIKSNPNGVIGLATGSTPIGMYSALAEMNKKGEIDFKNIKSYNLDEYYPIEASNDQSYRYFMNENLFSKINIDIKNTHVLDGMAKDPQIECDNYEKMIEEAGGIDIQVLGIGQNGHIAFNEPAEKLDAKTHLTGLTENTIKANSRFFASEEDVPKQALTMGIGTIMKCRKIVIIATGAAKKNAVAELLSGKIFTGNPSTILNAHSDVTLICDKAAYTNV